MEAGQTDKGLELVIPVFIVTYSVDDDVTLPCRLSPETSAVAMEIKWFKETNCIYQYKNGHVIEGRGYEGRVSIDPRELERGDMSLRLRKSRKQDRGQYRCQVISGQNLVEGRVQLLGFALQRWQRATYELLEISKQLEENKKTLEMEKTKQQLEEMDLEIAEKTHKLVEEKEKRQEMENQLKEKNREVEEMKRLLHERDKQIEERENTIKERDEKIKESEKDSQEKDRQLEMTDKNLLEKIRLLEEDNNRLKEKDKMRMDRGQQLKERDKKYGYGGGESTGPDTPVCPAVSELRLVLLGRSTVEKRAAGDTILGTCTHTSTETQHSESRQGEVAGKQVTVVETPDWFCSEVFERDMRQDVGLCVRLSAPGPHAFLLVIPVEPSEGEERRKGLLEKMEDILGEGCWGHSLILFTLAEGQRERSVEELLQTGSQELQKLLEKCGDRCHLLNMKGRPDDTKVTQLLEKIEEMVSGNRERFYSSDTYQEAERQFREIERRMQKEREMEKRNVREERERREEIVKNVQESLKKMEGEVQQHEGEIRVLNERTKELERNMEEEKDEEKRREMERELKREIALREEMEKKLIRVKEKREIEREQMEERHRREVEMRESYEKEARAEAERNLMKIILSDWQRYISITKEKMEGEFYRKMEEKDREMERLRQLLTERDSESERDRKAIQRLSTTVLEVMSPEEQHKCSLTLKPTGVNSPMRRPHSSTDIEDSDGEVETSVQ